MIGVSQMLKGFRGNCKKVMQNAFVRSKRLRLRISQCIPKGILLPFDGAKRSCLMRLCNPLAVSGQKEKAPNQMFRALCKQNDNNPENREMRPVFRNCCARFSHPDYTVGSGISPDHAFRLAGCTAGRESHPALKRNYENVLRRIFIMPQEKLLVKQMFRTGIA